MSDEREETMQTKTENGSETQISREDFYKLTGLLALAREHNAALATITRAAAQITGEPDEGYGYFGSTSDAVIEGTAADALLRKLGREVESDV